MDDKSKDKQSKFQQPWYRDRRFIVSLVILIVAVFSSPWWSRFFPVTSKSEQLITESNYENINSDLRALEPLETGKQIGELPNGVYFFVNPITVAYEINKPETNFLRATNRRRNNDSFEIQKVENRYYLIGFISDEAHSNIASVDLNNSMYTILFPNQWEGVRHPIAVPFDAIYAIRSRTLDIDEQTWIQVLDIDFKEVKDNPEVHI